MWRLISAVKAIPFVPRNIWSANTMQTGASCRVASASFIVIHANDVVPILLKRSFAQSQIELIILKAKNDRPDREVKMPVLRGRGDTPHVAGFIQR